MAPRSITIHITEDRWGNHMITLEKGGKQVGSAFAAIRGTQAAKTREPFWDQHTIITIADLLREHDDRGHRELMLAAEEIHVPE